MPDEPWEEPAPTVLKRDSATMKKVRQHATPVSVPRVTIVVGEETFEHAGEVCRVGSHPSNDVVLRDRTVSRFHCRLVHEDDRRRVIDCGSSNGTRLDGVSVRDAELEGRALLSLGDTVLRVTAREPEETLIAEASFGALIGASVAMKRLYALLERVAASDTNVLVLGESGTGKELVASEIVQRGARADKPFVVVDCGALSPALIESELFGHVRGAFTGADRERVGAFELAQGGTVFLDEIGELPLELQPKLLRVIQSREVRRVGDARPRKVDVRVIAATHRDLEREVNKGTFREDLYFRLAVIQARVPALRERAGDVPLLVRAFLEALRVPELEGVLFPASAMAELAAYDWPGNVRELRNHVERSVVLREPGSPSRRPSDPRTDSAAELPFRIAKERAIDGFERAYLTALMESSGGNVSKAARAAGMDRMYLHRLLHKHGLR